jgi:glucan phosphoethanolaminetransferase (alkaline phosphatase superfamily)
MPEPSPTSARLLPALLAELALSAVAPTVFLGLYLSRFDRPATAVLPHVALLGALWLAVATARMGARLLLPAVAARALGALVAGTTCCVVLLYYALVLGGLASWGHVISWELIVSYTAQAGELTEALAISLPAIVAGAGAALAIALGLAWLWLGRLDWTPACVDRASSVSLGIGTTAAAAMLAALATQFEFASIDWARAGEPVSLTVNPRTGGRIMQSHHLASDDGSDPASLAEAQSRASLAPTPGARRRNLVVIVVDALRPDHMGVYGYARDTTPWLSEMARTGRLQRFDGLRAVCAESACGLMGLFASRHVHEVPIRPVTLHQVLKTNGYRVEAILGGDHRNFYGMGDLYEGVDRYVDGGTLAARPPEGVRRYVNDDTLLLDAVAVLPKWDGTPTMLQFHLMSAHLLGKRHTPQMPFAPARPYVVDDNGSIGSAVNWYDNGVVQADRTIRLLLERLEAAGYLSDAIVAITADHGEALGEHGQFAHAAGLIDPVLKVPLLMIGYGAPELRPLVPRAIASQVDVAPTLLGELAIDVPPTWSGAQLTAPARPGPIRFQQGAEVGLIDTTDPSRPLKYWVHTRTGVERAYDLADDPGENHNRIATLPVGQRRGYRMDAMRRTPSALVVEHGDVSF